jgi:hypothetical protein
MISRLIEGIFPLIHRKGILPFLESPNNNYH